MSDCSIDGLIFYNPSTCVNNWNLVIPNNSLTTLGDYSGAVDEMSRSVVDSYDTAGGLYGAAFESVPEKYSSYTKDYPITLVPPWFGQDNEKTYMNYLKTMNEDPVDTYKQLKLSSIPDSYNSPVTNVTEGFGFKNNWVIHWLLVAIITFALFYWYIRSE